MCRKQAGGIDEGGIVIDNVVFRVFHDGCAAEDVDFAAEGDFASGLELTGQVGIAEPDYREIAGFVADYSPGGGLTPLAEPGLGGLPDDGAYGCVLPDFQVGDFSAAGVVFVVAGEVVEEVMDGVDVETGQLLGGLGVDAPESGDGLLEGFGVGGRGWFGRGGFWRGSTG